MYASVQCARSFGATVLCVVCRKYGVHSMRRRWWQTVLADSIRVKSVGFYRLAKSTCLFFERTLSPSSPSLHCLYCIPIYTSLSSLQLRLLSLFLYQTTVLPSYRLTVLPPYHLPLPHPSPSLVDFVPLPFLQFYLLPSPISLYVLSIPCIFIDKKYFDLSWSISPLCTTV